MLSAEDFILSMDVILIAGRQQSIAMIATKTIGVESSVERCSNEQIILREGLLTFGTFGDEQSSRKGEKNNCMLINGPNSAK
jgi:hypothetical protein